MHIGNLPPRYDDQEARRLFAEFAEKGGTNDRHLPPPETLRDAALALIDALARMAVRYGLSVDKLNEQEGLGIEVRGKGIGSAGGKNAIVRFRDGAIAVQTAWGKDEEKVALGWDPLEGRFEGLEDDPASDEKGYRRKKRSALATVADAVLKRLY